MKEGLVVGSGFVYNQEALLTIKKSSIFFTGDGFTVYDSTGSMVFRVESCGLDSREIDELVLMDAQGRCLLTFRRKRPSLHQRWEGYVGERINRDKPIFSVRRSSVIGRSSMTVDVFDSPSEEYQIEGSLAHQCCTIFNGENELVAEIKRKVDASTNVLLGKDVLSLIIKPGFDGAFAMGLFLVIDQINGDDFVDDHGYDVEPTTEDQVV